MTPFFSRSIRIEWGQCDPAGIVYAPRYLDMFGETTVLLFEAAGLPRKRDMLVQCRGSDDGRAEHRQHEGRPRPHPI